MRPDLQPRDHEWFAEITDTNRRSAEDIRAKSDGDDEWDEDLDEDEEADLDDDEYDEYDEYDDADDDEEEAGSERKRHKDYDEDAV